MKCSDSEKWSSPAIGTEKGYWNENMDCSGAGFRQVTGREHHGISTGIVNVRAICGNSWIEMTSNKDMRGKYNQDLDCADGKQVVGVQVRQDGVGMHQDKIINFRIVCA